MSSFHLGIVLLAAIVATDVQGFLDELGRNKATFLTASVGGHVIFNCPIDFPHDLVIPFSLNWNKEGRTVFSYSEGRLTASDPTFRGRVTLANDQAAGAGVGGGTGGGVNLTAIRESDAGWFECAVFFPNRKPNTRPNGTWSHLAVDGGTLLAEPPINVTILEGSTAVFPCVTSDQSADVVWHKDGLRLAELATFAQRITVRGDGTLQVADVRGSDSGEFTCVVTAATGERQTASAFLDVQFPAKVVFSPREVLFPFGGAAMLDCHFRSNPPLTNLRWEKDGFLFDPYNVPGVFYKRNGSLYFTQVDESHGGEYTCTPYNELGTSGTSPPIRVLVQRPPVFTLRPHNLYLRRLGESVQMSCAAVADASIVWLRKDGASLPANRTRMRNGNLTIERVEPTDRGVYQCVASNMAATLSSEAELKIESLSARPAHNLVATATSDAIAVSWTRGSGPSLDSHTLWWRARSESTWHRLRLPGAATSAQLRSLRAGQEYQLMVTSTEGEGGEGVVSRSLDVRTLPGQRSGVDNAIDSLDISELDNAGNTGNTGNLSAELPGAGAQPGSVVAVALAGGGACLLAALVAALYWKHRAQRR